MIRKRKDDDKGVRIEVQDGNGADALDKKEQAAAEPGRESLRVVIFGGGEYGFSLAQMLESWDCRVRIFEKDEQLCQQLTERLGRAL